MKSCLRCGKHFSKPAGYSVTQWEGKRFCSKRCGALKRRVSDIEIQGLYERGNSSNDIASLFGLSGTHVLRILRSAGCDIRGLSESMKISHNRPEVKTKFVIASTGRKLPESAKETLRSRIGPLNHNWRSGLTVSGGYLQFTSSEANGEHAGKSLHTVIAEWKIGRPLLPEEVVHHHDRNKQNNDPSNLMVMTQSEHAKLHAACGEFTRRKTA